MKILKSLLVFTLFFLDMYGQPEKQKFVSTDIDNFWTAYDKITSTKDSSLQTRYMKEMYLDRGTEGLKSLVQVRRYTAKEFIDAINSYPEFWKSLRENSLNTGQVISEIENDIVKLRTIYPSLKPSVIYFLIGAFRTNGTTHEGRVLIGCEYSLGDQTTITEEFTEQRQNFYRDFKPKENIGLLCTHEYVHTQQKQPADNLLSYCIYEGVCEFISCLATGKRSNSPGIAFGKANHKKVITKFLDDIYFFRLSDWLWGENSNELKERDLGYYIGYAICEKYYNGSADKAKAIKELIELDYANEQEVERIVDATKIFPASLKKMWREYNKKRPVVISIRPLKENVKVKPGLVQLSINFSQEMDTNYRGFDYGPLGENYIYKFKKLIGWSNNNKTLTLEVEVMPNKKYQTLISSTFRNKNGVRLKPFLIEFETKE